MMSFSDSVFARVLRGLAQAVYRHPKWFVYPQIVLAALCVFYTARGLKLDMNRSHLPGPNSKYNQIFRKFREEFPGQDELVVVVESPNQERNRQFIERLAAQVTPQTNLFADVFYKADLTRLGPKALLLVPANDLEKMRQSLRDYLPFIRNFSGATNFVSIFSQVNKEFRTAPRRQSTSTEAMLNAIPPLERIVDQARASIMRPGRPPPPGVEGFLGGGVDAEQKVYVTSDQGRIYLLAARPMNGAVVRQAIERLRQFIGQTQVEVPGVGVGLTGGPVLDYDEMRQAERDTIVAGITALVICSLIFIVAYRQVGRPLKAAFCLLIGIGYTLGFATLAVGHLNILSISFAPMIIGLAIDFGIHFISRYEEEMRHRRTEGEALQKAMAFTGQGIVTGGFTTAAGFLAMGLTQFKGIREMGIISGGGLLLCLIPMMTTLPALLLRGRQNLRDRQIGPAGQRRLRIENLWLRHPALVVSATLLLCAGAALQLHKVYFDYNLLHLQNNRLTSVVYEKKLLQSADRSAMFATVVAETPGQAREYEQRIKQLSSVAGVQSMASVLAEDQTRRLELARAIKRELAGVHFAPVDHREVQLPELSATLWYLTGYLGLAATETQRGNPELARKLSSFRASIEQLRKTMFSSRPRIPEQLTLFQQAFFGEVRRTFAALQNQDTNGPLRPRDLPPPLRDRFIGVTGKYLLQVYPRKDVWQRENQREFIQQLQSVVPPDQMAGAPIQIYEHTTLLKNSYQEAAWYSLGAIVVMILLHFRSLLSVVLSLLPVAIGGLWLLGFMGAAGVPFNPANIMTLPLVVGIGVTNGIQILNRFAEEQKPTILAKSTGKSVFVSGLTAITGFGTLLLGKGQGIRSLGEVMSVGIAACMIVGLTLLPALLGLLMRAGWTVGRPAGLAKQLREARALG